MGSRWEDSVSQKKQSGSECSNVMIPLLSILKGGPIQMLAIKNSKLNQCGPLREAYNAKCNSKVMLTTFLKTVFTLFKAGANSCLTAHPFMSTSWLVSAGWSSCVFALSGKVTGFEIHLTFKNDPELH